MSSDTPKYWIPKSFVSEEISVRFEEPPSVKKKPGPPSGFTWQQADFDIEAVLSRWVDFDRRGDSEKNMQPAHLRVARKRGSWGVGRFYFRVLTGVGRAFDIYYDRAPEGAGDREGHWFLWRELQSQDQPDS